MGQSGPVTTERAPVAESEQGAEPSCLVLGQLGPLAQAIPATSLGRAVVLLFMSWTPVRLCERGLGLCLGLGAGGWGLALALALALAPWFGTFKRHCLGTPGAHCLLLTSTLGLWLRCDSTLAAV